MFQDKALGRRVARLVRREHTALLAFSQMMTHEEYSEAITALRALGYYRTLPNNDPWAMPPAEKKAYADELERLRNEAAQNPDAELELIVARLLRQLRRKRATSRT